LNPRFEQLALILYKDHVGFHHMLSTSELVARIREQTGDTQEALARRVGVSFPTINAWERGRTTPRRFHRRRLEQLAEEVGLRHRFTVLVIDDDPVTVELVIAAATEVDGAISVEAALDGWEGLVKCGSLRPDLLFLDIMMPGIDGLEVARRLPSVEGLDEMSVVFVTSSNAPDVLDRARSIGHDLVPKPLELDVLADVMRKLLEATMRGPAGA
jgi:CheY-like chemotaxis protein